MGVIIGQECLCQGACLILWGLAWLADVNCMEVIKCEGNVMWAEFKCTDFVALIFFFFFCPFFLNLVPRRTERKIKVQRVRGADMGIRLRLSLLVKIWNRERVLCECHCPSYEPLSPDAGELAVLGCLSLFPAKYLISMYLCVHQGSGFFMLPGRFGGSYETDACFSSFAPFSA